MKIRKFILIFIMVITSLVVLTSAKECETTYDLNYLTKTHISIKNTIDLSYKDGRVDYVKIQKEAVNVKFNSSLGIEIPYGRYPLNEKSKLIEDLTYCKPDYKPKEELIPDKIQDTLIFNLSEESKKYSNITVYLEYDIP